jgi:hypothetical protein
MSWSMSAPFVTDGLQGWCIASGGVVARSQCIWSIRDLFFTVIDPRADASFRPRQRRDNRG